MYHDTKDTREEDSSNLHSAQKKWIILVSIRGNLHANKPLCKKTYLVQPRENMFCLWDTQPMEERDLPHRPIHVTEATGGLNTIREFNLIGDFNYPGHYYSSKLW